MIDLTGKRFGKLSVVKRVENKVGENGKSYPMWECQCDCGKTVIAYGAGLRRGQIVSCGCKNVKNLKGMRFGRLVAEEILKKRDVKRNALWKCSCDCGNYAIVKSTDLLSGNTTSCGCLRKEKAKILNKTHGKAGENKRLYNIWIGMNDRCYNSQNKFYYDYGGRGISVCKEWKGENGLNNFFEWSMKNGYQDNLTIDRIDNDKGYSPDNCRWATRKVQQNNKRTNRIIEYKGETHTLSEWSEILDIKYGTLLSRLNSGWSDEKTLTTPVKKKH